MRLQEQLYLTEDVQAVKRQYDAQGVPFGGLFDDAINRVTGGIEQPYTRKLAESVANLLLQWLEDELAKRAAETGKTKGGRIWRSIARVVLFVLPFLKKK